MSNYQGRKSEFTPAVYTRYFEHEETPKPSTGHIYFDDDNQEGSSTYQIKRDLIFKRLFPSKYANSNSNATETDQINPNGNNTSLLNNIVQPLGDFISLSHNNSSTVKRKQSSPLETDVILSSSDESEEDLFTEAQYPTRTHDLIAGHLHSRSTIENVRSILIRELYERTSDSNTEWLKCKMSIPREYINPKYYADFQRRYKNDLKKNTIKRTKSISIKDKMENGYYVHDLTTTNKTTIEINDTIEDDDIIEALSAKPIRNVSPSMPILLLNDTPDRSKSTPEFIVLDSDEDENNLTEDFTSDPTNSTFFIDRSSTGISHPPSTSNDDYHQEDSKYAQLPSRNTSSSSSFIRPIISKHQRRKQTTTKTVSSTPLVSAIDRIIDQMDVIDALETSKTAKGQNLLVKQLKKRKKKKKKKGSLLDPLII